MEYLGMLGCIMGLFALGYIIGTLIFNKYDDNDDEWWMGTLCILQWKIDI